MQKLPSTVHPLKKAVLRFHISPVKWTAGCFHTSLWPVHKTYDSRHLLSLHPSDLLRFPDNALLPAPVLIPEMALALDLTGAVLPPDVHIHNLFMYAEFRQLIASIRITEVGRLG